MVLHSFIHMQVNILQWQCVCVRERGRKVDGNFERIYAKPRCFLKHDVTDRSTESLEVLNAFTFVYFYFYFTVLHIWFLS